MDELYGKTGHATLQIRRGNVNMNLHIICNYIHCATQRIEEIFRAATFLYRDTKYTSVDSGTGAHSYFIYMKKTPYSPPKNMQELHSTLKNQILRKHFHSLRHKHHSSQKIIT